MIGQLLSLPRTIWLLALVSLCNDSASELLYPLVPLYLSSVLMAGPRALGFIEGVAEASGSVLKLVAGVMADRMARAKPFVVAGYGLAALARPMFAFAQSWPVVALLRFGDRLGKGLRTAPRDALLAAAAPAEIRGLAFGFHRAMDNLGAVIGPILAAWCLARGLPLRDVFLWAAVPGVLAVILSLALREPPAMPQNRQRFVWSWAGFPLPLKRYFWVLLLFTLGNSSNMFLLLRARELGMAEFEVPLLWALISGVAALASTPFSALSDRIGRMRLIVGGWIVYALFYGALALAQDIPLLLLWPVFGAYGLFLAATEGAEKALVADLAPRERLGAAYGWFNLLAGVALLPASLLFGALWQSVSATAAFLFSAACALLAAVLLRWWVAPAAR